jgi:hypothetical protein
VSYGRAALALLAPVAIVTALVFVFVSGDQVKAHGDEQLDKMLQSIQSKRATPQFGASKTCDGVVVKWIEIIEPNSALGSSVKFRIVNNSGHKAAVRFGYTLFDTNGRSVSVTFSNGVGDTLKAGASSREFASAGVSGSIDAKEPASRIDKDRLTFDKFWVADLDVEPKVEPNSYVSAFADYPVKKCGSSDR